MNQEAKADNPLKNSRAWLARVLAHFIALS
jgi:hypothetical protein